MPRGVVVLLVLCAVAGAQEIEDTWEVPDDLLEAAQAFWDEDFCRAWDVVHGDSGIPVGRKEVDILRAGLRLDADAGIACAKRLTRRQLDAWETRRVVDLLLPIAFEPDSGVDFQKLRHMLGSDDVAALFEAMSAREGEEWNSTAGRWKAHVYARADHAPIACRYIFSSDERIRRVAEAILWSNMRFSDRHRPLIAATILRVAGLEEGKDDRRPGLPRALAGLLRLDWLTPGAPDVVQRLPGDFGLRWLQDERPASHDAGLLVALLERFGEEGMEGARSVVVRAMAHLRDERTWGVLESLLEKGDAFAAAALAHRGDEGALDRLVAMGRSDAVALALLLEWKPDEAVTVVEELCGTDPWRLVAMEDLRHVGRRWRMLWQDDVVSRIADVILAADIASPVVRIACALEFPGCLTGAIVDASLEVLESRDGDDRLVRLPVELDAHASRPEIDEDRIAAHLEVLRPDRFRTLLREWLAQTEVPGVAVFAWSVLRDIGGHEGAAAALAYVESRGEWDDVGSLGRFPSEAVRAFLLDAIESGSPDGKKEGAARALTELSGVPRPLVWAVVEYFGGGLEEELDELETVVRENVIAGRGVDAFMTILESGDWAGYGIGWMRDERVRRWLLDRREERHLDSYAWATGELSLLGDVHARAETWSVIRHGRYGWLSDLTKPLLTDGIDAATMSWWIEETETQCCRISMGATPVDYIDDSVSWFQGAELGGMTPYEYLSRWWKRCDGRVAWSRYAERFVALPRP